MNTNELTEEMAQVLFRTMFIDGSKWRLEDCRGGAAAVMALVSDYRSAGITAALDRVERAPESEAGGSTDLLRHGRED